MKLHFSGHSHFSTIGILLAPVKYAQKDGECQQMKNGSIKKDSLTANIKPETRCEEKWDLEVMMLV
jgi:hypothetical protein